MSRKLRAYPEYKESGTPWLGQVPTHWTVFRIKNVLRERDHRTLDGVGALLSLTRVRGLIAHGDATDKLHSASTLVGYKLYYPGQIVMNRMQAWSGMFGATGLNGLVSPDYAVFDIIGEHDADFLLARLKAPDLVDQFALQSRGIGSGFNRLYTDRFGSIAIALPDNKEQDAIVRFLDWATGRLDRAIRIKRKLIALLNEQKQAIIHRVVTRGRWNVLPLKSVCFIQSGITLGKAYFGQSVSEYPYLRVANVQAGLLNLEVIKTISIPTTEAGRFTLRVGDVLMTEGGDPDKLGRGCVWDGQINPCLHQNHIFAVRPNQQKLMSEYLSAVLGSKYARDYFLVTAKQTTNLAATNRTTIGRFRIHLPKIEEQAQILRELEGEVAPIYRAIGRANRELMLLAEYRTRLIADVVTGKLDVRGVEIPAEATATAAQPLEAAELETEEDELVEEYADAD